MTIYIYLNKLPWYVPLETPTLRPIRCIRLNSPTSFCSNSPVLAHLRSRVRRPRVVSFFWRNISQTFFEVFNDSYFKLGSQKLPAKRDSSRRITDERSWKTSTGPLIDNFKSMCKYALEMHEQSVTNVAPSTSQSAVKPKPHLPRTSFAKQTAGRHGVAWPPQLNLACKKWLFSGKTTFWGSPFFSWQHSGRPEAPLRSRCAEVHPPIRLHSLTQKNYDVNPNFETSKNIQKRDLPKNPRRRSPSKIWNLRPSFHQEKKHSCLRAPGRFAAEFWGSYFFAHWKNPTEQLVY